MHRASVETLYLEGLELWDQILRVRRLGSTSAKWEDSAPSASLDHPKAQAAPTHPGAQRRQLEGLPWPQQPASGRPQSRGRSTFNNQVRDVDVLIGVTGSGLANLAFLRPGALVLELVGSAACSG